MSAWQDYLKDNKQAHIDQLVEFCSIPSISSLPEYADEVRRAGQWTLDKFKAVGLENVAMYETGGHPVVYGDWLHAEGQPTVLIYGHFDTQPVDPLNLWTNPPFEPTIRDGRLYARGATDDKGNFFAPLTVIEAMLKTEGKLPINIKFFTEGQEEIGSPQLPEWVAANKEMLKADMVLSADGSQYSKDQPALQNGFRGLSALQIDVEGPKSDVHSGGFGGAIANPLHALVRLLDTMRGPDGKIMVEGFYDDVRVLTDEDRAKFAEVPFNEEEYLEAVGAEALFGEPGYTTYERLWVRPTLEINGMGGGFQDEGVKTVLPSKAMAKISCRLVPDQDPHKINDLIEAHIKKHCPKEVRIKVTKSKSGAYPYIMESDHPGLVAAGEVFREIYGKEPYWTRMGGTVPVCSLFQRVVGMDTILFGFGLSDENQHGPDEFMRLSSIDKAQRAYGLLMNKLMK